MCSHVGMGRAICQAWTSTPSSAPGARRPRSAWAVACPAQGHPGLLPSAPLCRHTGSPAAICEVYPPPSSHLHPLQLGTMELSFIERGVGVLVFNFPCVAFWGGGIGDRKGGARPLSRPMRLCIELRLLSALMSMFSGFG